MPDINISDAIITDIVKDLGQFGLWIQAIGLVIVIWIVFQIITLINDRIKRRKLYSIQERLEVLEKKIDKLLIKKK